MLWKDAYTVFQGMLENRHDFHGQHIPLIYVAFLAFGVHSKRYEDVETFLNLIEDSRLRSVVKDIVFKLAPTLEYRSHAERYLRTVSRKLPAVDEIVNVPSSAGFVLYMMAEMQEDSISRQDHHI